MRRRIYISQFKSFESIKRIIYLWIIPFILIILISYYALDHGLKSGNPINLLIVQSLIIWYTIAWFFIFLNRFIQYMEIGILVVITFSHIVTVYDSIVNYMANGQDNAVGIDVIWVPLIILVFFLILSPKKGLIYSLAIFTILLSFGIYHFTSIPIEYILTLCQFYFSYLVYILTFYFALRLAKIHIEIESIQKIAYTDFLTGIANRHKIENFLVNQIEDSRTNKMPLSILFFDMDHFKLVNDTYGHKVGDSVLIQLANLVENQLEKDDMFGRWGGEEFIIVTRRSRDKAMEYAEQLRGEISEHQFEINGKQTASFGVTEVINGETLDSLISRVDKGLYLSKQSGRDLVTLV